MQSQIEYLARLGFVDLRLDEFEDEFGDLPEQLREVEQRYKKHKAMVHETEGILNDVRKFIVTSKDTLLQLKDKEEKLSKQQFLVRNNKEFDAITKEIEHTRNEYNLLTGEMRKIGVKEENLNLLLVEQKKVAEESEKEYKLKQEEFTDITSGQNLDVKKYRKIRDGIKKEIQNGFYDEYQRIRNFHKDAVVQLRKNSCSGCFSAIPPQKIVLMRNNLNTIYFCENCGRILCPEEVGIDESFLD
jgi:predicted  nucleic acid-binding Zn-ribbon protein